MIKKQFSKTKSVCKVTFSLPKEAVNGAKEVKVIGDFNDWNWEKGVKMKASGKEYKAVVELPTGKEYQFRYLMDNQTWENDWAADNYVRSPYTNVENSVVVLPSVTGVPVKKAAKKTVAKKTTAKPVAKKVTAKKPVARKVTTKKGTAKPTAKKTVAKKAVTKKAVAKKVVAKKTTKAKTVKVTDLTVIEGVGPKIASLLNKAGIKTFSDLSKAKVTTLKTVLADAGNRFKMHNPTSWPKQAKLAAANKWTALKTLQAKLNGGK